MDDGYIVYAHYIPNTNTVFYIGEGRPKRIRDRFNRNRYWNFKVDKYDGFDSEVLVNGIDDKAQAESIEASLIQHLIESGESLTNLSIGPAFGNHWSRLDLNYDKTMHPMYGKKFPGGPASIRMTAWNIERRGSKSPVFGLKRPDLSHRNKHGKFKRYTRPITCIDTGIDFESIKAAREHLGMPGINIHRALKSGSRAGGYRWKYTE